MPDFTGQEGYLGVAYSASEGVPASVAQYIDFESMGIFPEFTGSPNPSIRPRVGRQRSRRMSGVPNGSTNTVADPESLARIVAHQLGKVTTTTPAAGAHQHVIVPLQPNDAAPATYRKELTVYGYNGDGEPWRIHKAKVSQRVLTFAEEEWVMESFDLIGADWTTLKEPVFVGGVGTSFTGTAHVFGTPRASLADDIIAEVTTAGNMDGTAKIKVKVGAGAAFGATTYSVVSGQRIRLSDENDSPLGPAAWNPVELLLIGQTGSTTALVVGDKWTIAETGTILTPSYTARNDYSGAQVISVKVDGTEVDYPVSGVTVSVATPFEAEVGLKGISPKRVLKSDYADVTITFQRKYVDTVFWNKLLADADVTLYVEVIGDEIGSTGVYDKRITEIAAASINAGGSGGVSSGPSVPDESVTIVAYDNGTDPIIKETFVNTIAAL